MHKLLAIFLLAAGLSACDSRLFEEPAPVTTADYAEKVCKTAGAESQSCNEASQQTALRCYRTIGTVDCYLSEDPFQTNATGRFFTTPVDGRAPTPSPG